MVKDIQTNKKVWISLEFFQVSVNEKKFFSFGYCESESRSVVSTRWGPMDYTVHGIHGILQARILEWVAFPFSRGSSQPRDGTQVSCIAGGFFTIWATGKPKKLEWVAAYPFFCIAGRFFINSAIREVLIEF